MNYIRNKSHLFLQREKQMIPNPVYCGTRTARKVCVKTTLNFINVTTDLEECVKIKNSIVKRFFVTAEEEIIGKIDNKWYYGRLNAFSVWDSCHAYGKHSYINVCRGFPYFCMLENKLRKC